MKSPYFSLNIRLLFSDLFRIRIWIRILFRIRNPDPKPDPKCLFRFRIGSGSGQKFRILTDPAKSFGFLRIRIRFRIRIRNTAYNWYGLAMSLAQRGMNDLWRAWLSCGCLIWLHAHPLPPFPVIKLPLFLSLPVCRRSSSLTGEGGGGGRGAESYDASLALKSKALKNFFHLYDACTIALTLQPRHLYL
jgi:hypothetical protein